MKFIIGGENGFDWLERLAYRGAIGIFYEDTIHGVLAYIIFGTICILAIIGLFSVIKWVFTRNRRKETPGQKWMRTGKM